jgi:hypothetical protein
MCHLVQGIWINFIPPGNQNFFIKNEWPGKYEKFKNRRTSMSQILDP